MRIPVPLAVALTLPALTGCSAGAPEQPVSSTLVSATSTVLETLEVKCSPTGLTLSSQQVAATSGGVRISVSSTAPAGTYANFSWDGGGEGHPAPATAAVWTLPTPPGDLQISCSTPAEEWPAQNVLVVDPHHHWRQTTMSDLGCPPGITPAWNIPGPGRGATAHAAVTNLLASTTGTDWTQATATPAPIGYPEAPIQTWIVSLSNRAEISVHVDTANATSEANPDTVCHP